MILEIIKWWFISGALIVTAIYLTHYVEVAKELEDQRLTTVGKAVALLVSYSLNVAIWPVLTYFTVISLGRKK